MSAKAKDILRDLQAMGTEQNQKVYRRHGVTGDLFGVSYAQLRPLAKSLGKDNALAAELWSSGNHDARVLACMVADAASLSEAMADGWVRELSNYVVAEEFAKLIAAAPFAQKKIKAWTRSANEWPASAGWTTLSVYALQNPLPADVYFEEYLSIIARDIHKKPNRVRHSMNQAVIAIGVRNEALQEAALRVAHSVGKVVVDHGDTNCVTPDAAAYILKTVERRKRIADTKAAKAKAKRKNGSMRLN